jgi:hypothetical protein
MTSKRLFLFLAALLSLLLTVAPAGADDSGGVAAQILTQDPGGGVIAPVPADPVVPDVQADAAQQETTPTTPGGEEQPPDGETDTDQGTTTDDSGGTIPGTGDEGDTGAGGESGGLPRTGLEIAALAMIGLGLLMAGLALRPTSSWPPPRDRLSRSIPPR